jgi:hypothetical protein
MKWNQKRKWKINPLIFISIHEYFNEAYVEK